MDNVIEIKNLVKKFNGFTAVDGITFSVKQGEVFAFLGPNGAGKSTTIKILITLLRPTSGGGTINGYDFLREPSEVRGSIGYVPQMISVDGALTAYENLMLMARLYGISAKERKERVKEVLAFLKLQEHARSLAKNFSGGMIRKLEIGQTMLHHPRVLFLDEPTTGLDPIAKQSVWEHLLELRDQFGTTIFFSTHNMEEAEKMCDRVAIMNVGRISIIGSVSELTEKTGKPSASLEDAFMFFTGNKFREGGNFTDIGRTRRTQSRLG